MLGEALDRPFGPEMAPSRPGEVQRIAIDSSQAGGQLGWSAQTSLAEGLSRTAEAFAARQ
jgi:nucleoside-diphosphate-sugar epimerase